MNRAAPFHPVVKDVLGPGFAFDVDQHSRCRTLEPQGDDRAQVSLLVLVGVEVSGESSLGEVVDRADVLHVSGILSFATHPHCLVRIW